jgi:two-component system, LytTR family, sensor kinase
MAPFPPLTQIAPYSPRVVAGVFAAATLFSLSRLAQMAVVAQLRGLPFALGHQVASQISFWYGWALVALCGLALVRRTPDPTARFASGIAAQLGIAVLMITSQPAVDAIIHNLLPALPFLPPLREHVPFGDLYRLKLAANLQVNVLVTALAAGIAYAVTFHQRFLERDRAATQLANQLTQARLDALRAQLNPHFLFNAMNTIAMLARDGQTTDVVRVVTGLSDLLRWSLDDERPPELSLREELAVVGKYLAIEQVRFQNRLRVELSIAPESEDALVPTFVLQPLVENAIRHGISQRRAAGLVAIRAQRDGERLVLQVRDDGPGPPHGQPHSAGVGLRNTRARLQQLYRDEFTLELSAHPDGGALVTLSIPFRTAGSPVR